VLLSEPLVLLSEPLVLLSSSSLTLEPSSDGKSPGVEALLEPSLQPVSATMNPRRYAALWWVMTASPDRAGKCKAMWTSVLQRLLM
ncbi:hypothetical protein JYT28_01670, partial [Desulfobulbus sp. AH-315-M07]|nr:hypothetical protein [Desulfobulbus sp. AH-315-M07]